MRSSILHRAGCFAAPGGIRKLANAPIDLFDDVIRRGSSRRNAYRSDVSKPPRAQIRVGLHMVDVRTMPSTGLHQLARVVAVGAADDDDHIALPCQISSGDL